MNKQELPQPPVLSTGGIFQHQLRCLCHTEETTMLLPRLFFSLSLLFCLSLPLSAETFSCDDSALEANLTKLKSESESGNPAATRQVYLRYTLHGHTEQARAWAEKYVSQLKEKANSRDAKAAWLLGRAYMTGDDYVKPDNAEAIRWFTQASEAGEPSAAYIIGELLTKAGNTADARVAYARAYSLYKKEAESGNADALYWQGYMEQNGFGVPVQQAAGIEHMEQAAEQGSLPAAYQLFKTYTKGLGIPEDETKALHYARILADKGGDAQMAYVVADALLKGKGTQKDEASALPYLERAAAENIPAAIYHMAWRKQEAGKHAEALADYRRAASMGHADAAVQAGIMMLYGKGVDKDEATGLNYLRKASEQLRSPFAPYELAKYYDALGETALADDYYITASDRGLAPAMTRRGLLHLVPFSGLRWGPTETYRWWKEGSNAGDETCTLYLRLYLYVFIPLVLILVFGLPILLVRSLHKTSINEFADTDAGKQP